MFLLFAGDIYYPGGGWKDYRGTYDTLEAALDAYSKTECEWYEIVDLSGKVPCVVKEG